MRRRLAIGMFSVVGLLCALYAGDYAVLRYRAARNRGPFGTVTVYRYYAIQKKANKVEYVFNGTEDQTCVHALFSHMSYPPCWYLERHTEQRTNI
jgi:hypothetical protein